MFKQFIAPIQSWLLKNSQCVGCGMPLKLAREKQYGGSTKVFCKCGRVFVKEGAGYRRALFDEV